jgi:hypothetical protein
MQVMLCSACHAVVASSVSPIASQANSSKSHPLHLLLQKMDYLWLYFRLVWIPDALMVLYAAKTVSEVVYCSHRVIHCLPSAQVSRIDIRRVRKNLQSVQESLLLRPAGTPNYDATRANLQVALLGLLVCLNIAELAHELVDKRTPVSLEPSPESNADACSCVTQDDDVQHVYFCVAAFFNILFFAASIFFKR